MKPEITQKQLKEIVSYNEFTGEFTWNKHYFKSKEGKRADFISSSGYMSISIKTKPNLAHRLAWLYMTGELPKFNIDHIDGDRTNNRFNNLRNVESVVNSQNQRKPHKDNLTGLLGVSRHVKNRFKASINILGKAKHIGTYKSAEDAGNAYIRAKRELHEGCTI